jgi:hypothetical protein
MTFKTKEPIVSDTDILQKKIYKFKNPFPDEVNNRYIVLEERGDDFLVQEVSVCKDLSFKPVSQLKKSEFIEV